MSSNRKVVFTEVMSTSSDPLRVNCTLTAYIGICLYVRMFVHTFVHMYVRACPNSVTALQTSFLNQLSRNFTRVHKHHLLYEFEHGHHRSHVTPPPLDRGLLPPWNGVTALQTSFLNRLPRNFTRVHKHHLLYEFENRHHRSHVTPLIGGLCPPENSNTSDLMKLKPYVLASK